MSFTLLRFSLLGSWDGNRGLMVVAIQAGVRPRIGKPVPIRIQLDSGSTQTNSDVSPDGRRLIAILQNDLAPPAIVVVENWLEELWSVLSRE